MSLLGRIAKWADRAARERRQAELRADPNADKWFVRRWITTKDDPDWRGAFIPFCESPAEEAFLKAMIAQCELAPSEGLLVSPGIQLNLQQTIDCYRADFVVNDLLVVENDGEAYHGSPEAQARDRKRDDFMQGKGYVVLRIPAVVALRNPADAVGRVRAALASPIGPQADRNVPPNPPKRRSAGEWIDTVSNGIDKFNHGVRVGVARDASIKSLQEAADAEADAVENVVLYVLRNLQHSDDFGGDVFALASSSRSKHMTPERRRLMSELEVARMLVPGRRTTWFVPELKLPPHMPILRWTNRSRRVARRSCQGESVTSSACVNVSPRIPISHAECSRRSKRTIPASYGHVSSRAPRARFCEGRGWQKSRVSSQQVGISL